MSDRILFNIWENRTLPAETWQRFTEKAQRAGSTPARVLRQLIERYLESTDYEDNARGNLRQG
jgi:predicted DNA-binding protein